MGLHFGLLRLFIEMFCVSRSDTREISCINPFLFVITGHEKLYIIRFIACGIGYDNIYTGW